MSDPVDGNGRSYDSTYKRFDSRLSRQLRQEAYGEDIGQHSWVTADELRNDVTDLGLAPTHRLLDLGCGPGGPLTFVAALTGCPGTGLDVSTAAIVAARERAAAKGVDGLLTFRQADLDAPIALGDKSFQSAMSLDVILHLRDRAACFREVARILAPGGRFLVTDAGVLTGVISSDELALRSVHGRTQIAVPGVNERLIEQAGLRLLKTEDRTAGLLKNAEGRLQSRLVHHEELQHLEGPAEFERQQQYLQCVVSLSQRGVLRRMMYLAAV